jgi:nitrogen fixation/metabolism regulation signal transduction histidine kinase
VEKAVRNQRKRIWIDRFQTYLFLRMGFYFICYQVAVWSLVAVERCLSATFEAMLGPVEAAYCFLIMAVAVIVLGFVFIYDAVVLSHRIVGPLYRFRQAIKAVTAGGEQSLVALRKGDYLQDMKDDFNEMLRALEERGAVVLKAPGEKQGAGQRVFAGSAS